MQTVGPETSFKAGLGAMEIACSAMEIAATQTLCEDEASLKAGLEGMEIAIDIAAQGSLSLVMHLCLCLLTLPLQNFHGPHFLLLDTLYIYIFLLPHRVCCHWLSAMPAQHMKAPEQAREDTSPAKIDVTSKSPVGDISVVTLIRTDTTLDHSQKAEKV